MLPMSVLCAMLYHQPKGNFSRDMRYLLCRQAVSASQMVLLLLSLLLSCLCYCLHYLSYCRCYL